ncbi:PadR family transcriptional regulator [Mycobacterium sp. CBMA 234]|uniref:PadR family transcriptional regulator n=1 Tax=Mycolicibacterium sp. CBMA 234 TaxID=1918495 RepID=UPI0012DE125D|nr:PadR family transcriptional regulator [Mycolicibacterium sp. CBMA 234]MUL64594.1 PadR family transcriptional regulator [Mycolicibacterium sp. CBMA 234]
MALRHAILAALADGESSGYDLAKSFDIAIANFWTANPQQLYRELEKMESEGLVQARLVQQDRRPNKNLFALTDAGRFALHEFTAHAPKPIAIRDELLVQVEAMELGNIPSIRANLESKLASAQRKLMRYQRNREHLLGGRTEQDYLEHADRLGPYLTLARGIAFEAENVRWCQFVLTVLARRSGGIKPSQTSASASAYQEG